jgi:glycosyltransferase involved in cell wall biosynthesis
VSANEKITLAIPYYRGREHLRQAIRSVLAQDEPEWLLSVRDDGERDEARTVIDELGLSDDPRVDCVANPANLGMVANWNACLDAVGTPLVTLLHADDALEPSYVKTMRALAREHPEPTAFFCEARIIDAHGTPRFSFADWVKRFYLPAEARRGDVFALRGEAALVSVMAGNFIMCPTLCFRLDALAGRRFDARHRQVQDLELTSRLLMDGDTLVGTRQTAYAYRRHAEGATARQSESLLRFHEELALFDRVAARADSLGWRRAARVARRKTIVRLHLGYRVLGDAARLQLGRAARELMLAASGKPPPS